MNIRQELETQVGDLEGLRFNNIEVDPENISAIMINEVHHQRGEEAEDRVYHREKKSKFQMASEDIAVMCGLIQKQQDE